LIRYDDRWYLTFCSDLPTQSDQRRATGAGTGTYYLRADGPFGPHHLVDARPLKADPDGSTYAGRLIDRGSAGLAFLAWERVGPNASFIGAISDPIPVLVGADGHLVLDEHP
jgi:hypothetical protein